MSNFQSYQAPMRQEPLQSSGQHRGNFASYQTQAPASEAPTGPAVRIDADAGRTSRVTVQGGVYTAESTSSGRVTAAEINPHYGDGTVFATAKSMHGIGVTEIKGDTLLTIDGVQAPASFFESHGLVHRGQHGEYREGSGQDDPLQAEAAANEVSEAANADDLSMPSEVAEAVDNALDGVPDHGIAPLIGLGIGAAVGQIDRASLESRLAQFSGASPAEAAARVSTMAAAYQMQADAALENRGGIAAGDIASFYAWAKANHQGELRGAVESQIHGNNFGGYRALADRYLADNPPSLVAVQAGGYETRGGKGTEPAEVFIDQRWLTIRTAAKLGYL